MKRIECSYMINSLTKTVICRTLNDELARCAVSHISKYYRIYSNIVWNIRFGCNELYEKG